MATRAYIGIVNPDGTVRSIYAHYDNYVSGTGRVLHQYYTNTDTVNQLIDLGNVSVVGTTPVGYWTDIFAEQDPSKCLTYRERGEEDQDAQTHATKEEFLEYATEEYTFLFENGEWFVRYETSSFRPLKELIAELDARGFYNF